MPRRWLSGTTIATWLDGSIGLFSLGRPMIFGTRNRSSRDGSESMPLASGFPGPCGTLLTIDSSARWSFGPELMAVPMRHTRPTRSTEAWDTQLGPFALHAIGHYRLLDSIAWSWSTTPGM